MDTQPLKIGIPARFFYQEEGRNPMYGPKTYVAVEQDTLDYVSRTGALPMMIPPMQDHLLQSFIGDLDGILLQGGSDMAPESYGERPLHEDRWLGDPYRDAFELKVVEIAMERGLPILGICRGFQVLNVYFGGTLYQDIPTQVAGSIPHRNIELYDGYFHGVRFAKGGLLEEIYTNEKFQTVNSIHHQGIKDLGSGLLIEAYCAEDGLIEAFVHESEPRGMIMGVQWHPEFFHHFEGELISPTTWIDHWLGICRGKKALLDI